MKNLSVTVKTGREEFKKLEFDLYQTPTALKWARLLKKTLEEKPQFREPNRFYGFPNDMRVNQAWIVDKLNDCIQTVNSFRPQSIPTTVKSPLDQDKLNYLHTFFERYAGPTPERQYFENAPEKVKTALSDFNETIHRCEWVNAQEKKKQTSSAMFIVTFPFVHESFADEDYEQFTLRYNFGEVYINYCLVGKHLWEMALDQDEVATDENIRPQNQYSPDFLVSFGGSDSDQFLERKYKMFDQWWSQNEQRLSRLGYRKGDPKNAVGHVPVGRLKNADSIEQERQPFIDQFIEPLEYWQVTVD